jgi:predicted nucleic acid-binding protein
MTRVLDSHALMLFLEKEKGHEILEKILFNSIEKEEPLLMTSVNYSEILAIVLRECDKEKAAELETTIDNLPIRIMDVDASLSREAARIRAERRLSLANSFAAALTKSRRGELITGDKEFRNMETDIKILWIS